MNRGEKSEDEQGYSHRVNRGKESEDEQGYTVYDVSQIHKNTLSEAEKNALNYTAIYHETVTFLYILVRKHPINTSIIKGVVLGLR